MPEFPSSFHRDKAIRTGGGFTYYQREGHTGQGKNPARWKGVNPPVEGK